MVDRVLLGDIGGGDFGLLVSQPGIDVKSAGLNQLIFDSRYPVNSFPIYKIFDVTVAAGSGSPSSPGSYTTTHTSGGLGYIPFVLGFRKKTASSFSGDSWLLIDSVDGSPSTPSESGFVWEIDDTELTVYNYFTSQQTFRIVLFQLDITGGATGTTLTEPTLSETTGYRSDRGWIIGWTGVSGATGYRLDIATDAGFTTFPTLDQTYNNYLIPGGATTTRTVRSASATTNYYIRVRAEDGTASGPDSNIVSLTTDSTTAPIINYSGGSPIYQDSSIFTPSFSISNGGVGCDVTFSDNSSAISPSTISDVQEGVTINSKSFTSLPRSGTATTCTIQASIGSNSDIENIQVYRPIVELGSTISVSDTEVTPADAYAGVQLLSDGRIRISTSGGSGYTNLRDFVTPQNSSAAGLYQAKISGVSGTSPSGASAGVWLDLTSSRTWYLLRSTDTPGTTTSSFTLEIRPVGGAVLDSVTVNLSAQVTAVPATFDLSSLNGDIIDVDKIGGGAAQTGIAGVRFETDGTLSEIADGIVSDGLDGTEWWDAAPSSGIGSGKYVRFEKASGGANATWTGASLDTWHELSSTVDAELTITDTIANGVSENDSWVINVWVNDSQTKTGAESASFTISVSADRIF